MQTAIIIAFLIILGSVLGVLIIGSKIKKKPEISMPVIFRRPMERIEATDHQEAASLFRSAFQFEMAMLRDFLINVPETAGVVVAMLGNARYLHNSAYTLFRPFVSDSVKPGFDRAWKEYCYPLGGGLEEESEPFLEYKTGGIQPIISVMLVIKNMKKLLRFAEPSA
jgi:hypothetical protein